MMRLSYFFCLLWKIFRVEEAHESFGLYNEMCFIGILISFELIKVKLCDLKHPKNLFLSFI